MQKLSASAAILGLGLIGSAAIAGCGIQSATAVASTITPSSHQTTSPSPSITGSATGVSAGTPITSTAPSSPAAPANPFPTIIGMAMAHVPSNLLRNPMAPTELPLAQSGSTNMYYDRTVTEEPVPSYSVQLSSRSASLASFGATSYSSAQQAADAAAINPYAQGPGGTTNGQEDLGSHISGAVITYNGQATSAMTNQPWAAVTWHEGRWLIDVSNYGSTTVPTAEAKQVVAVLATHYLPPPQIQGALFVSLYKNSGASTASMEVDAQWEEGSTTYMVDAYNGAVNPLDTAIRMAIAMTPYSG